MGLAIKYGNGYFNYFASYNWITLYNDFRGEGRVVINSSWINENKHCENSHLGFTGLRILMECISCSLQGDSLSERLLNLMI